MPNIGPFELVIVLIIALVFLGPKRLPDIGRSLGSGMRQFKDGLSGQDAETPPETIPAEARAAEEPEPEVVAADTAEQASTSARP